MSLISRNVTQVITVTIVLKIKYLGFKTRYTYVCGTVLRTLKRKVQKVTLLQFYRIMGVPTLYYGRSGPYQKMIVSTQFADMNVCLQWQHIKKW